MTDEVDGILAAWRVERPDLDVSPMAVLSRVARLADGPLQKIERALGASHAGTHATVRAHTPREDVVDGAEAVESDEHPLSEAA